MQTKLYVSIWSSFLLGIAAMVMTWQTFYILLPGHVTRNLFFFSGTTTFTAYIGYWHLSYRKTMQPNRPLLRWQQTLLILGLVGSLCWTLLWLEHFRWIALSIGFTCLYTAPLMINHPIIRVLHYGKSILLAIIWTYSTTLLPIKISGLPIPINLHVFLWSRFLWVLLLCILFDWRDLKKDQQYGWPNFLHWISSRNFPFFFYTVLAVFFLQSFLLYPSTFPFSHWVIWILPGVLLGFSFPFIKKQQHIWVYYVFIDGLMMLSGLIMILLRF